MTVLFLLAFLMAAGMGAIVSVQNDLRMTANLRAGVIAAYLADAGVEWSKQRIAATTTMPPAVSNDTQSLAAGSYSVSVLSSSQSTPLSATVVLRSVGSAENATQAVHARITKIYDLADAAIVLRGNARRLSFAGSAFSISGLDQDLTTGVPIPGSRSRAAITVGATGLLNQVDSALDSLQRVNIVGDDGTGAAIAIGQRISGTDIDRIAADLCAAPNAIVGVVPSAGSLSITSEPWGSHASPQLRCVSGLPGSGDSVVFTGNSGGAGILVIRDAELVISGNFRWDGWVIVSGSDIGVRIADMESKQLLGALIVAESGNATGTGPPMLDIQGSLRIGFSRQAFTLAAPLLPVATLSTSYSAFPSFLRQDYWRSIGP
jgi:hypothetical protein